MERIVEAILRRISNPERITTMGNCPRNPPVTSRHVDAAEDAIGFAIPPLLRRLYLEVGNGCFGPGYGLVGVDGCGSDECHSDIVELYRAHSSEHWAKRFPRWPDRILRVAYFGCAMYAAVDCNESEFPIYLFEPNPSEDDLGYANCLVPYERGLDDWLLAWANGEDVDFPRALIIDS